MTYPEQIDGERLAKDEAVRSHAREVLAQPTYPFPWWHGPALTFVGAGLGWTLSAMAGSGGQVLLGVLAGVSFFLTTSAFRECTSLRRRLDSLVILLRTRDAL
jgi:hypothetical protein